MHRHQNLNSGNRRANGLRYCNKSVMLFEIVAIFETISYYVVRCMIHKNMRIMIIEKDRLT